MKPEEIIKYIEKNSELLKSEVEKENPKAMEIGKWYHMLRKCWDGMSQVFMEEAIKDFEKWKNESLLK